MRVMRLVLCTSKIGFVNPSNSTTWQNARWPKMTGSALIMQMVKERALDDDDEAECKSSNDFNVFTARSLSSSSDLNPTPSPTVASPPPAWQVGGTSYRQSRGFSRCARYNVPAPLARNELSIPVDTELAHIERCDPDLEKEEIPGLWSGHQQSSCICLRQTMTLACILEPVSRWAGTNLEVS